MSDILPEFKKWIVVISVSWGATFIALICYKYIISILLAIMFQDSMDMNLSKLQEIVKDSEPRQAAVLGVTKRIRHDLVAKQQNNNYLIIKFWNFL